MEDEVDFVKKFYNLEGNSKNERTENFFRLIRTPSLFSNENQLENALKNLKPRTYQENLFYLDLLIFFKRTDELLEIFQRGNDIFTSKILKQAWFFESAFKEMDVEKFVDNFLPCVSYSVRKKLLTRISKCWNEKKMDSLFDALYIKYGLPVATWILTRCTVPKIQFVLDGYQLKLRANQVLQLYDKSENLFTVYLDHINQITNSQYKEMKVLNHVAKSNPKLLIQLEKDKKVEVSSFGKRVSKCLLDVVKHDLPSISEHYLYILYNPILVRKLGRNYDCIFKKHFPRRIRAIWYDWTFRTLIRYYPKTRRWDLFQQTLFEKFSHTGLDEALISVSESLLRELNCPKEIFTKWAEINYQDGKYMRYLEYYEINTAIAIIKGKISKTSCSLERRKWVTLMMSVCYKNDNMAALQQVLEYICSRHEHEDADFRNYILRGLWGCKFEDLNENHWKFIEKLLNDLRAEGRLQYECLQFLVAKYLEFLFTTGKDYKATVTDYVKEPTYTSLHLRNPPIENRIYTEILNNISDDIYQSCGKFKERQIAFLLTVMHFSLNNPECCIKITDFPRLSPIIQEIFCKTEGFKNTDQEFISTMVLYNIKFPHFAVPLDTNFLQTLHCITRQNNALSSFYTVIHKSLARDRNKTANEVLEYYFENLIGDYPDKGVIDWFLKHEPDTLLPYFDKIVQNHSLVWGILDCSIEEFTRKQRNETVNGILLFYLENVFEIHPSDSLVSWFLKYEPTTLAPHFDKVVRCSLTDSDLLDYNLIRHYSHLSFDRNVVEAYMNKLDDEDIEEKIDLVNPLRILLSTDDFLKLINERYLPKKDKLDLEDEEMRAVYDLQCQIARTLAKVSEPCKAIPTVMTFCRGDYLQSGLPSLYRAFSRTPERMLYSYVEDLSKRAVSARKHSIFLSCSFLNKSHALNILITTNECNISSHKYHFSAVLKFFAKNPSPDLLEKVLECMDKTDKNDLETLDSLCDEMIPIKYRTRYAEYCWRFYEKIELKGVNIDSYLNRLINSMFKDIIESLSVGFIIDIINRYLPKREDYTFTNFLVMILHKRKTERNQNINLVFSLLSKLPDSSRRKFVDHFVNYCRRNELDDSMPLLFYKHWVENFSIITSFPEHISLKLILLKFENSTGTFASRVVDYLDQLTVEFGFHAYDHLQRALRDTVNRMENEKYSFFLDILKYKAIPTTCVLVLELIGRPPYGKKEIELVDNIMSILRNVESPIVRIYYKSYMEINGEASRMGDESDFITNFHHLEGDLLGERKEHLFRLLRKPSLFLNEEQLESTLKNIKPSTYQENLFHVYTLIYFKRTSELLEILLKGNVLFARIILKQSWFAESVFKEMEVEKLVCDILPRLSYSLKHKVLNKISKFWNPERMDLLFDAVYAKYGLTMAVPISHKCSLPKLETTVKEYDLKLHPKQVLELYERNEDSFKIYLDYFNKISKDKYGEKKVINHIAQNNPRLLLQLKENGQIKVKCFGKRTSRTILNVVNKNELLSNSKFYFSFLKISVIVEKLKLENMFETFYKQSFPKSLQSIHSSSSASKYLKYYPKHRKWNLFLQTCNEKYPGKSFDDILLAINEVEGLDPPRDILRRWAEIKYTKEEELGHTSMCKTCLKYFEPSKAITIIKEKIDVTSEILGRSTLIDLMLRVCQESNDMVALENVLKYICFRHRNEDAEVKNQILRAVGKYFNLKDFNENHWKCIDEQISILRIRKKFVYMDHITLVEEYLEFLLKNGKNCKQAITEYINDMVTSYTPLSLESLPLQKRIYIEICKLFSEVVKVDCLKSHQVNLLELIVKFSKNNPEHCIKITDFADFVSLITESSGKTENFDNEDLRLIPIIISYNIQFSHFAVPLGYSILEIMRRIIVQEETYKGFSSVLKEILLKKERSDAVNEILVFYFENVFEIYPETSVVDWFLLNEPRTLAPYFDKIVEKSVKHGLLDKSYYIIKQCSHLNFDKTVCEYYRSKLDYVYTEKESINALRILLPTDEFMHLINDRYLPKSDKFDIKYTIVGQMKYFQCELVKMLPDVLEPYKFLTTIMKYCRGDYLQSALKALHQAFYATPERTLYSYIKELSKHISKRRLIRLSSAVLDKEYALDMLKGANEDDKYYFSIILKFFLRQPSQALLNKVLESMSNIKTLNKNQLEMLTKVTIPTKYRRQYVQHCWRCLVALGESYEVKIDVYLEKLIEQLSEEMLRSLSINFIAQVVKRHFSQERKGRNYVLNDFVIKILRNRTSERDQILELIFVNISGEPSNSQKWFLEELIVVARNEIVDPNLLNLVQQRWNNFSFIDNFKKHVALKLVLLKSESSCVKEFAASTVDYLDQLIEEFGPHVNTPFKTPLLFTLMCSGKKQQLSFCLGVLQHKVNPTTCILVLDLIRSINVEDSKEGGDIYQNILYILKHVETPIVRINYNEFVRIRD